MCLPELQRYCLGWAVPVISPCCACHFTLLCLSFHPAVPVISPCCACITHLSNLPASSTLAKPITHVPHLLLDRSYLVRLEASALSSALPMFGH
jgi:hypothetical protein